jgi:hypothetical protein
MNDRRCCEEFVTKYSLQIIDTTIISPQKKIRNVRTRGEVLDFFISREEITCNEWTNILNSCEHLHLALEGESR